MKDAVNPELTRKIASLSRLKLNDDEVERYTTELAKILDFVAQLSEVNVASSPRSTAFRSSRASARMSR